MKYDDLVNSLKGIDLSAINKKATLIGIDYGNSEDETVITTGGILSGKFNFFSKLRTKGIPLNGDQSVKEVLDNMKKIANTLMIT